MPDRNSSPRTALSRLEQMEMRLALQRLAAGYYNRPDVLRVVARKILRLEDKNQL
jgi:hypothetical protein